MTNEMPGLFNVQVSEDLWQRRAILKQKQTFWKMDIANGRFTGSGKTLLTC